MFTFSRLKNHRILHDDEEAYRCHVCKINFEDKYRLEQHTRTRDHRTKTQTMQKERRELEDISGDRDSIF